MRSEEDLTQLLHAFNTQHLSKTAWTHEAHLMVGLMHVQQFEFHDAICRMRAGIILLNHQQGTDNTGQKGYHETLTIFWLTILGLYAENHSFSDRKDMVNSFLRSPLADRDLPLLFYNKEKVLSGLCRSQFIKPDKIEMSSKTIDEILKEKKSIS